MNKYALITGASKGIGKEIAILLAKAGYNVLLIARSEIELKQLVKVIEQNHHGNACYFSCDLSESDASQKVFDWCSSKTSELSVLINNAGYGLFGRFEELTIEDQLNMLRLNITAVIELTHRLLPQLKQQKQSYILNISSTAAYQPVPFLALYSASKSFVLSYSRALRYELKHTSVAVSCLSPGPTDTAFTSRAGLDALSNLAEKFNMPPEYVAKIGLKGMFNKKSEIIPGVVNQLSVFAASHLPKSLVEWVTTNLYKL